MFAETGVALPPVPDAELTIFDIAAALGTDDAPDVLERYVRSILVAWVQHHEAIGAWARPFNR
jgi:hypothetical protein